MYYCVMGLEPHIWTSSHLQALAFLYTARGDHVCGKKFHDLLLGTGETFQVRMYV